MKNISDKTIGVSTKKMNFGSEYSSFQLILVGVNNIDNLIVDQVLIMDPSISALSLTSIVVFSNGKMPNNKIIKKKKPF